jgi:hypothetical protein
MKLFDLVRSVTFTFASLQCVYLLWFTLVRSVLESAYVMWHSLTFTHFNMLERIQQKFATLHFNRFFLRVHTVMRMHCSSFKITLALNSAFLFWKLLVEFLLGISEHFSMSHSCSSSKICLSAKYATYLLTYSWSWALLEKPPIVQLLENFSAFYETRRFITVFTRALHWSLSLAR